MMHTKLDKEKEETKKRIHELSKANSQQLIENNEDESNIIDEDRVENDIE